ncbi:MAG: hypothetical protein KJ017_09925 [Alphaproteobacteria bacterium]|nr:hypothetical protein [Alphaproteobacteria bacterium]
MAEDIKKAKLKKEIRNLSRLRSDINDEKIDQICSEIFLCLLLGQNNELPHAMSSSEKKAISELKKFEKLAFSLARHIQTMHNSARNMLEDRGVNPNISSHLLKDQLIEYIRLSLKNRTEFSKKHSEKKYSPRRPKKIAAEWVTEYLFDSYEILTGERPKRNSRDGYEQGEFFEFVKKVFSILEVNASADAQLRRVFKSEKTKAKNA